MIQTVFYVCDFHCFGIKQLHNMFQGIGFEQDVQYNPNAPRMLDGIPSYRNVNRTAAQEILWYATSSDWRGKILANARPHIGIVLAPEKDLGYSKPHISHYKSLGVPWLQCNDTSSDLISHIQTLFARKGTGTTANGKIDYLDITKQIVGG